jgi:Carboxypeptidase regulatory-like domain/TonB dependent receptor
VRKSHGLPLSLRHTIALLCVCVAFWVSPCAGSQSLDAVLKGIVRDQHGAPLSGATVELESQAMGLTRSATTDKDGRYVLHPLPPGIYDVRVELAGFEAVASGAQTLSVGATIDMDFVLAVGGITERVTVTEGPPLLETSKNTLTRIVQMPEIDQLPVANRSFDGLADLAPGVTKSGSSGGVSISGSADFQNAYQVDGVSAERQHGGDLRIVFAQDWIQEFQVMTSQYNAEFGQASGGVLNVVTRSGGSQHRGRGYGFFRHDALDAAPALTTRKPPLSQQRVGGTLGGPILKSRAFYFAGVEHLRNRSSNVVTSAFPAANGTFPSTEDQTLWLAKVDVAPSDVHRLRLRYNGQSGRATGAAVGGIGTHEHGRTSDRSADDLVGGWTWIASASTLYEARAAWIQSRPEDGCTFAVQFPAGPWFERAYPGGLFGCPVNFGSIAESQLQIVQNLSWTRGAHDVKVGGQLVRTRSFGDFRNVRDGRFSFQRDLPFDLSVPDSHPFSFVIISGPTAWDLASWSGGVFAQDRWRMGDQVTLNLGIRFDVDSALTALNPLVRLDKGLHTMDRDSNNIAPRAGIAWTPFPGNKQTMIRGGVGLYYDQNHNNVAVALLLNNVLVDRIVSLNANSPLGNPFWPDIAAAKRFLAQALAAGQVPDLSALGTVTGTTNDIDRRLQIPATTQASVGVAHEFRRWATASADFVYARGYDQYVIRNVNLDPVTLQRVNPEYSAINAFGNGGWNRYRALQIQLSTVVGAQQFIKMGYTLADNRSNTMATLSAGVATNPFDYSEDEGAADTDVRHTLVVDGSTALPGGLQISGIMRYRSALPYSAVSSAPRPDGKPFGFRPEPRNARRGDGALSLDVRVATQLKFVSHVSVLPFAEVFNVTNTLNYGDYIGTITSALFGQRTTAGPRRRTQLGLRIDW